MSVTIVSSSPGRVVLARSPWTGRIGRSNPTASADSTRRPETQVPQQRSAPPELSSQPKLSA